MVDSSNIQEERDLQEARSAREEAYRSVESAEIVVVRAQAANAGIKTIVEANGFLTRFRKIIGATP